MLVIRRTDTGGLRVSDGRRTDTAATEEHARRVVTAWGYGNFSFNRALILMKESEGSIAPVANPWLARRGAEPSAPASPAAAAPHAEPRSEPAASSSLKEPPTMNVPARSRRPRAAGVPTPEEIPVAPASPVVTADAPVAETALHPRRARKARPADAEPSPGAAEAAPETVAATPIAETTASDMPASDSPMAAAETTKAEAGTRPKRARKSETPAAEPAVEAPQAGIEPSVQPPEEAPAAPAAARPKRPRNGAVPQVEDASAAEPSIVAKTATVPDQEPETAPARRRGRRPKAEPSGTADVRPAAMAGAVPVAGPASEPVPEASAPVPTETDAAPWPKRARTPRRAATESVPAHASAEAAAAIPAPIDVESPAPAPKAERARRTERVRADAARTPEEWLEAARVLFAEGTHALREIESATLPFARGPWTELRTRSAEILACLQGRKPDRS